MSLQVLPQKAPEESHPFSFNFSSLVEGTDTVASATVTVEVWAGVDPSPSSILVSTPTVLNNIVEQWIQGGVAGVIYKLTVTALTAGAQQLVITSYLAVVEDPL